MCSIRSCFKIPKSVAPEVRNKNRDISHFCWSLGIQTISTTPIENPHNLSSSSRWRRMNQEQANSCWEIFAGYQCEFYLQVTLLCCLEFFPCTEVWDAQILQQEFRAVARPQNSTKYNFVLKMPKLIHLQPSQSQAVILMLGLLQIHISFYA